MNNLMRHRADVYRPTIQQATTQQIGYYTQVFSDVPCFIQPLDSKEAFYYEQRGLQNVHTIYTTSVCNAYLRNDVFNHKGSDYHVVGVKNALLSNLYIELAAEQYPEGAKRRLDTTAFSSSSSSSSSGP